MRCVGEIRQRLFQRNAVCEIGQRKSHVRHCVIPEFSLTGNTAVPFLFRHPNIFRRDEMSAKCRTQSGAQTSQQSGAQISQRRVTELAWARRVTPEHITSPRGMRTSMFTGSERDDTRRNIMRNKLLATVAMTALIGCASFAVAQNGGPQGGAMQSQGAQQHQMGGQGGSPGGGAMSTPSGGSAQNEPSTSAPQGSSPQGKGFSQEERNKSSTKPNPQGSAQEQRGPQNQRG